MPKQRKTYSLSELAIKQLETIREFHNRSASNQIEQLIDQEHQRISEAQSPRKGKNEHFNR